MADLAGPQPPRDESRFRIAHAGYLHTEDGLRLRQVGWARRALGGTYAPIDVLPRSHYFLMQAVEALIARRPELGSRIEVVLAGALTQVDRDLAAPHPWMRLLGYVSHPDTVELLRASNLLFLPMHDLEEGTRAGLVPGKTYEYLATKTPVLAAIPDGDARDILEEAGNALLCRPKDVAAMTDLIAGQIEQWEAGIEPEAPDPAVLARFERQALTDDLADVLQAVATDALPSRLQTLELSGETR
jgi:glycosyltransferase involved in cell wall biosynthesis